MCCCPPRGRLADLTQSQKPSSRSLAVLLACPAVSRCIGSRRERCVQHFYLAAMMLSRGIAQRLGLGSDPLASRDLARIQPKCRHYATSEEPAPPRRRSFPLDAHDSHVPCSQDDVLSSCVLSFSVCGTTGTLTLAQRRNVGRSRLIRSRSCFHNVGGGSTRPFTTSWSSFASRCVAAASYVGQMLDTAQNLCGTFCFSMQFVVFMERALLSFVCETCEECCCTVLGTVVLPVAICLTYTLVIK